jgi:hypothetical protein
MTDRYFIDFLAETRQGMALALTSDALRDLVMAIDATDKGGELIVKVKIKPSKADENAREVDIDVSTKLPRRRIPPGIVFSDGKGRLSRANPRQLEMRMEGVADLNSRRTPAAE